MKFTVIFAFFAVVAACFMLPTSDAAIVTRDADAFSALMGSGATAAAKFMESMGSGMNSMMDAGKTMFQAAQKTSSDGMKEMAKDITSLVPGSDKAADAKTDKKQ